MTELRIENLELPGCHIRDENPLPMFRDPQTDRQVPLRDSVPAEVRKYFGWQAGRRVLPYRMQDQYSRQRETMTMRVAVLENDFLKATFWIELGGRLMSLIYKPLNRELLYANPAFQPANLALRNAWFAGGIEWDLGHVGHNFQTCSPVFAAAIRDAAGEPGLRLYEFDRCKGMLWHTDFTLPAQSEFLFAFTRVLNPQEEDTSMYWWTNMAVAELPGTRVLAPTADALYLDRDIAGFGFATLPDLPSLPGKDPTYSLNWPRANEFFFQCDGADMPWEAALDAQGSGFVEASTPRLKSRKLFCWGTGPGGRHWQEFLALPGMAYLEIQAGLGPTQLHHLPFAAHEEWYWTEAFGYLQADPQQVHDPNYQAAWRAVDVVLKRRITAEKLAAVEAACRAKADEPAEQILQNGSGWGRLEIARREQSGGMQNIPRSFVFPEATLGKEQEGWLAVLYGQNLPVRPPSENPGEWMTQKAWRDLLEGVLKIPEYRSWFALLHYGVMLAEHLEPARAAAVWRESIEKAPSAWAYRNLAAISQAEGRLEEARGLYAQAWQLAQTANSALEPVAYEALSLLYQMGEYSNAWEMSESLTAQAAATDRFQILRAMIALKIDRLETVEAILQRDFATVREGQVDLTDIWFEMWRRRAALRRGRPWEEISLEEIKAAHPAPAAIDFRMDI